MRNGWFGLARVGSGPYICLIGDEGEEGRHDKPVYDCEAGRSLGPAEVLVSVRGHGCRRSAVPVLDRGVSVRRQFSRLSKTGVKQGFLRTPHL